MAGNWTTQNKVLPGVYFRFRSTQQNGVTVGNRGTVAICKPLSWGPVAEIMTIEEGQDPTPFVGGDITSDNAQFLREMFKGTNRTAGANKVLLYRPPASSSAEASVTVGNLTATAQYPGAKGNDITIVITENTDDTFTVDTVVGGDVVDEQIGITDAGDLSENAWVAFSGEGALTATVGAALVGGLDGTVSDSAFATFLTKIEPYNFDVLCYDGSSSTVITAFRTFIIAQNEDNGIHSQLVVANAPSAPDSRYVVNVVSDVVMDDGDELSAVEVTWWAAGALAGASYNESLTNATYPGAVGTTRLTASQYVSALNAGKFVLAEDNGRVYVVQDVNTLTTYTPDISEVYRYNKTVRLCNTIANDLAAEFSRNYLGIVNNNAQGRSMFKAAIVGYLLDIEGNEGIQNFDPSDVTVEQGQNINAILITIVVRPVGTAEKIYVTITMEVD